MRYFRYKNTDKNINNALQEQYKTLTANERRTLRKQRRWRIFATIVILLVLSASFVASIVLNDFIPGPSAWYWFVPYFIGKGLITGIMLFVGCVLVFVCDDDKNFKTMAGIQLVNCKHLDERAVASFRESVRLPVS